VNLVLRNSGTADDAEDLLQESLVVLWERVRSGRFEYKARLSTFIYATARNIWMQTLRKREARATSELDPEAHEDPALSPLDVLIQTEHSTQISEALGKIGEQCRKLLLLFYWEELSMNEIALQLGFANADTAKAKKYQCKKNLEELLRRTTRQG
jgi:RNA polymerase sigma factor (sigma-70 family)